MPLSPRRVQSSAPASHKKPAPNCPQCRSAKLPAPRRVPCTFKASVTHIKCASLTQEASALALAALRAAAQCCCRGPTSLE
eukprot:6000624-Prymnesium_polylepis.1